MIFVFFLPFGYCECYLHEHLCTCLCLNTCFQSKRTHLGVHLLGHMIPLYLKFEQPSNFIQFNIPLNKCIRVLCISPALVISFVAVGFQIIAILVGPLLKVGSRSLAVFVELSISSFSCVCVFVLLFVFVSVRCI